MTEQQEGGPLGEEAKTRGGVEQGGKMQVSIPDVPYSAITFSMTDDPDTAMFWASKWREDYLAVFGTQTTETTVPVADGPPSETQGVGFKVNGRWPDGKPRVQCVTCKTPKTPQYPATMYLNEPEGQFGFVLERLGLDESAYTCSVVAPTGERCQNYITLVYAEQMAS